MKRHNILAILQGRLFQIMIIAVTAAVLLLAAVSLYLTSVGFDTLQTAVTGDLRSSQAKTRQTLDDNLGQVSESVSNARQGTAAALSAHLNKSMAKELSITEATLHTSLTETADALATMLAEVAPEAILGNRFSALVSYVKVANRNRHVVYAVYVRADGSPYTRYIDRDSPKVTRLLEQGSGRTPIDRLLSAAGQDPDIEEISKQILFDGKVLGAVKLGFDISDMKTQLVEMQTRFNALIAGTNEQTREILDTEAGELIGRLDRNFQSVNHQHNDAVQAAEDKIERSSAHLIRNQVIATLFAGFLVLLGLCLFFMLRVIQPLNRLTTAMQDIAAGEGDLTQRLPERGRDEISRVAAAFNRFVGKIQQAMTQASRSTSQLSAATDVLAEIARQSSDNVSAQQVETQQVASAITQMSQAVKEISRSAESAAAAALEANREADVGKQAVLETGQAIHTLAAEVNEAARVINELGTESESIGSVLEVIRGIADQTNLLALNAAIEAARAGEQGRGFAVVADEVRTLASRTQESTREIHNIIEQLLAGTRKAAQVMNTGLTTTEATVEKANRAGEALDGIVSGIATISQINARIAQASVQHAESTEDIDRRVERIAELAQTATHGSTETAHKSRELAQLGDELTLVVGQFQV